MGHSSSMVSSGSQALLFVITVAILVELGLVLADKKGGSQLPDLDKILKGSLSPAFGRELANVSKAANRAAFYTEYDTVITAFQKLLIREAEKGTRMIHVTIVNPDRKFSQGEDLSRYNDLIQYMLRGKTGMSPEDQAGVMNSVMGCLPQRERMCLEKINRASRLGSWITVENCHRWFQAHELLGDGVSEELDLPEVSIDWKRLCVECFSERVQVAVNAFRQQGQECLQLSDEEAESFVAQFPSNWTIDVSTRTTIGGMRMEERKLLPIGGRWMPLSNAQSLVLEELVASGVHIKPLNQDGTMGQPISASTILEMGPGAIFNFAIFFW